MTLHWGSEAIQKVLPQQLRDRIGEACCDPEYKPSPEDADLVHYAGHTGEVLFRTPATNAISVSRRKMRQLFSDGLEIQYGKRLTSIERIEGGVVASFGDGSAIRADLIVGCDGSRSVLREMLVGSEAAKMSCMDVNMLNFPAKLDGETAHLIRSKHPIFFNSVHPEGYLYWLRILDVPDTFQNIFSWPGPPMPNELDTQEKRTAWLKSRASSYAEPWRTVLERMPSDIKFAIDPVTIWSPVDWAESPFAGRVTLAGDAAHSIPPFRGQGLQNGLEDAARLTEQLTRVKDLAEGWECAVFAYEEEMIPRGVREVEIGRMSAIMFHDYEKVLESPLAKMGLRRSHEGDVKRDEENVDSPMDPPSH